ncbi:unnamed protein product [Lymnaea stagnalis]|uniref:beta-N-acetylhexosaminidase n=1 Tax=Lymnaea stagnalis TaxID=6523 RepID=A0AAV2ILR9_LYMST
MGLFGILLLFCICTGAPMLTQDELNQTADGLRVTWTVLTNTREVERFEVEVTLENWASIEILSYGSWKIYFNCIFLIEPDALRDGKKTAELKGQGLKVTHVQGSFFYLEPTTSFIPLKPGGKRKINFKVKYWSVARTDVMPNWYIAAPGLEPVPIASTQGEPLSFVADYATPGQWKRYDYDYYNPYTAQERYDRNYIPHAADDSEIRLVPKPTSVKMDSSRRLAVDRTWFISFTGPLSEEATYLGDFLNLGTGQILPASQRPGPNVISLRTARGELPASPAGSSMSNDTYKIEINANTKRITLVGASPSGVFYAVVSLINLLGDNFELPEGVVLDSPRFEYRGLMLDIARNFHSKDEIIEIIELMSRYKLNKLHLHLTDDEGWRLEIPALPELTELGSQRCHDVTETRCLLPQLGSGPDNSTAYGSGYLTTRDYLDILQRANQRHVTVIPEVDMPGHARAAIKAMELRRKRNDESGAGEEGIKTYLTDVNDTSSYTTPQMFSDNAVNPCLESTYTFVKIVLDEILELHQQASQPLTMFHMGGDEVGPGAWVNSSACKSLKSAGLLMGGSPKSHFFQRVSNLSAERGLSLAAWEDGLMEEGNNPFNLTKTPSKIVYAYTWDNVWEWGTVPRTYTLANRGYKVVMAHGSHLYFDHPYEPDPEERGYYWATRFSDTRKAFSYNARRFYDNILTRRSGQPITDEEMCGGNNVNCPPLVNSDNIAGMEATLFSETTRTRDQLHDRLFPRLLAVAERAWHEADWERLPKGPERDETFLEDWFSFVRAVGHRELKRLDVAGVTYRIPPPGAKVEHGLLLVTPLFPGLRVHYSYDGLQWRDASGPTVSVLDHKYLIWLRTVTADEKRYSRTIVLHPSQPLPAVNQPIIDYISQNLTIQFTVVDNYLKYGEQYFETNVQLTNEGNITIPEGNWRIYFPSVNTVEPEYLLEGQDYVDRKLKMTIDHVSGYLYSLGPESGFTGLEPWNDVNLTFRISNWCVSRYEQMPRWYVSAPGMRARDVVSTVGEDVHYVTPFTRKEQLRRFTEDQFDPWTPGARYDRNKNLEVTPLPAQPVLPTPLNYTHVGGGGLFNLLDGPVTIVYEESTLARVAEMLKDMLETFVSGINLSIEGDPPTARYIRIQLGDVTGSGSNPEAYRIKVNPETNVVDITAPTTHGAFYGAVTLLHMALKNSPAGSLPSCELTDWPRFPYRGMHLDTGRNFMEKATVLKLLDVMAIYKLNKLHFHLSDDEGWRLEIPGLEELTQIGSRRCHDLEERECVMSTLGSGAGTDNSGTGYYTVGQYKEILTYARDRHVEVIPEFDTPGHAHAAIVAMKNRKRKLENMGNSSEANLYLLHDERDHSHYFSVQTYTDNAVNPCIESTYRFIEEVYQQVKEMHRTIQPLKVFHFGGDEVAKGAWVNSSACAQLLRSGVNLKREFTRRVAEITKDVTLGAWEDGLMDHESLPWNRSLLANEDVIAQAWQNVWEWGAASRAYNLANLGYKVVFSPVTHLYLDHPQEPSPEESGFYWGTRYTDAYKTFSFMPDHYYLNADIMRSGEKITLDEICNEDMSGCPPLTKPENIIGLQGQLWSEIVRTPQQLDYMVFPRLLSLAERAWHKGSWEGKEKAFRDKEIKPDWARFANSVGSVDLAILDKLDVSYRVPPPGARQTGDTISTNVEFPGLKVQYRLSSESSWSVLGAAKTFKEGEDVFLRTLSPDGERHSSEVKVTMVKVTSPSTNKGNGGDVPVVSTMLLLLSLCLQAKYFS